MITLDSGTEATTATEALPEVWCVIPHFGDDAVLKACHDSLKEIDYPQELFNEDRIIVVNNNPPNRNLLFTAAINRGMLHVQQERRRLGQTGPCMIWLLNNDTIVDSQCVREAARCFAETGWDQTGIVGPRNVLLEDPDNIVWGGSKRPFPFGQHKTGSVSRGELAERTEEEWVTFASPFLNGAMVDALGVLDANLCHVASDSDYCLRARYQGWRHYYEPAAVVKHAVGTSNRNAPEWLQQRMHQDRQQFVLKWLQPNALLARLTRYPARLENGQVVYPE